MRACPYPARRASDTWFGGIGSPVRRRAAYALFALVCLASPLAAEEAPHDLSDAARMAAFEAGVAAYDEGEFTEAYEHWLPLAKGGDLAAQRNVGHLLRLGLGTAKDPERALYFYERAAEAGMPAAALNAAMMHLGQDGGTRDPRAALPLLEEAAEAGYPLAFFELGQLYETGEGVEKDGIKAGRLYRLAAALGHEEARKKIDFESRLDETRKPGTVPPPPRLESPRPPNS